MDGRITDFSGPVIGTTAGTSSLLGRDLLFSEGGQVQFVQHTAELHGIHGLRLFRRRNAPNARKNPPSCVFHAKLPPVTMLSGAVKGGQADFWAGFLLIRSARDYSTLAERHY